MVLHTGTQSTRLVHNIHPASKAGPGGGPALSPPSPSGHPKFVPAPFFSTFCMPARPWGLTGNISPAPQPLPSPQHPGEGRSPPTTAQLPPVPQGPPSSCPVAEPREAELGSVVFFAKMFLKYSSFGWFGFGGMEWDPPGVTEETLRETAAL